MAEYYLLDLERTIVFKKPYFWKRDKHGYTSELYFAGLFTKEEAEKIAEDDKDKRTAIIHYQMVYDADALNMKTHERT